MITLFGKVLVFVMVFAALVAVGLAGWLAVGARDFPAEIKAVNADHAQRVAKATREARALAAILHEKDRGSREMPWDIEAQLFGGKLKSVAETKRDITELDKEINKLSDEKNTKVDTRNALLDDIKKQRDETEKAIAIQKDLRQTIAPDPDAQPGGKSFRDRLEDLRVAKAAAEDQYEKVRPDLFNEAVRVSVLLKRQDELRKRLEELKKGQAAANAQP